MRPHRLTVSGFLAYGERIEVPFDQLSESGLFLIQGETGAGKTALLDAMAFAIFGRLPGVRGEVTTSLRSQHAAETTETYVELDATVDGRRVQIRRNPEYLRPKARGTGTTTQKARVAVKQWTNDDWEPVSGNHDEVARFLRDWIGLDAEQFFKLVLLPQGDFAAFLEASSAQRMAILSKLFADELLVFQRVQDWFKREHDAAATAVEIASQTLRIQRERIAEVLSAQAVQAEDVADAVWVGEQLSQLEATAGQLAEQASDAARKQQQATRAHADGVERIRASQRYRDAAALVDSAERKLQTFREQQQDFLPLQLTQEEAAKRLEELDVSARRAFDEADKRNAQRLEIAEARRRVAALRETTVELQQEIASAIATRAGLEERRQALQVIVQAGVQASAGIREAVDAASVLAQRVKLARDRDEQQRRLAEAEREFAAADERVSAAERAVQQAQAGLHASLAAELAATLAAGAPCPVCGSTEHPLPAMYAQEADRGVVELAEQRLQAVRTERESIATSRNTAAGLLAAHREQLAAAADLPRETLLAELEAAQQQVASLEAQIEAMQAANVDIESINATATDDAQRLQELTERQQANAAEIAGAASRLLELERQAGVQADDAVALLDTEVLAQRCERLSMLRSQLATLTLDVNAAASALTAFAATDDDGMPNLSDLEMAQADAELAAQNANAVAALAAERVSKLRDRLAPFTEQLQAYSQATTDLARIAAIAGPINGQRPSRMRLVSYYLAARLRQVIEHANARLLRMTSGRYTFVFDEEATGRGDQSLEIAVLDAWNGGQRPVKTLSGGETFTASLALALGLADIVEAEAGGKVLESLFVDEGFGTLSPEYLNRVMEDLDVLRASGRCIGIISHVTELRQRIPMQLEVVKSNTGSTVRITDLEG